MLLDRSPLQSARKQLWMILAIVFFGFVALSMPYLIFPSLFLNPAYSILPESSSDASRGILLGVTLAAYPFGQFLGSPIVGALSDDFGRRRVMSFSLLITAACSLLTAFSLVWKVLWLLVLSRFIAGLMEGNLAVARAMAADIKEIDKHSTFGKINAAASTAYIFGPLIGGVLSDHSLHEDLSLATPFFIICTIFLSLSLVSAFAITDRPPAARAPSRTVWQRINFVSRLRVLFTNKALKLNLIVVSLFTLAIDMFYEFGPVYLTAEWMLGPAKLAVYNGFLAIAIALGSGWCAAWLAARYPLRKLLIVSINMISICFIAVVLTDQVPVMLTIFTILGFGIGVSTTNLTVEVSNAVADDIQGEVMGVQMSLRVCGDAAICLIGGASLAISPAIMILAAALVASTSLLYFLAKSSKA